MINIFCMLSVVHCGNGNVSFEHLLVEKDKYLIAASHTVLMCGARLPDTSN